MLIFLELIFIKNFHFLFFLQYDDSATNKSPNQYKMLSKKLILTDGWYSIQASIDEAMIKYIISGKIKEGTKLLTYGSELLNCAQGCPPLEVNIFEDLFKFQQKIFIIYYF